MAAVDSAQASSVLAAMLAQSTAGATTGIKTRLTTNIPTATSGSGTQLTGSGYTAGGTLTAWNAPSAGATSNTTVLTWTNGSGSSWMIAGLELWDEAGTPLRWFYGEWNGGVAVSVGASNTFQVAAGGIEITLS